MPFCTVRRISFIPVIFTNHVIAFDAQSKPKCSAQCLMTASLMFHETFSDDLPTYSTRNFFPITQEVVSPLMVRLTICPPLPSRHLLQRVPHLRPIQNALPTSITPASI